MTPRRRTRPISPLGFALFTAASSLALGCSNSGLTKYDEIPPDESTGGEEDDGDEDPVPVIDDEECATQCNVALQQFAELEADGCYLDCDVGIGVGFDGEASGNLLWSIIEVEADGELQIGGSCNLVLECVEPCQMFFTDCARVNPDNAEYFAACVEQYDQCRREAPCAEALGTCTTAASDAQDQCQADGYAPDYCQDVFSEANCWCNAVYEACLLDEDELQECPDLVSDPPPLPANPAPGTWIVAQAFVDAQIGRLAQIEAEVFLIPRVNAQHELLGVELRSIRPGDTLHSLGLRNGDLVRSIGGHLMDEVMDDLSLMFGALSQDQVPVVVRRNGVNRNLVYKIVD